MKEKGIRLPDDVITYGYVKGFADCLTGIEELANIAVKQGDLNSMRGLVAVFNRIMDGIYYGEVMLKELEGKLDEQLEKAPDMFVSEDEQACAKPMPQAVHLPLGRGQTLTIIVGGRK